MTLKAYEDSLLAVLTAARVDVAIFSTYSTRGASSSAAANVGIMEGS